MPKARRNSVEKCAELLKPQSNEICVMLRLAEAGSRKIRAHADSLTLRKYSDGH
jgi:hypothetical protein